MALLPSSGNGHKKSPVNNRGNSRATLSDEGRKTWGQGKNVTMGLAKMPATKNKTPNTTLIKPVDIAL